VFGIGCGGGVHKFVGEVSEVMASKWEKHDFTNGDGSKPWYLVNPKIAGKWMFIPLKMYL
jgi:hypothetical protein